MANHSDPFSPDPFSPMKRLAENWTTDAATTPFGEYGAVLYRGLHTGQFLRRVERANR